MLRRYREISTGAAQLPSSSSSSSLVDDVGDGSGEAEAVTPFPKNKRSPKKQEDSVEMSPKQRAERVMRRNGSVMQMITSSDRKQRVRSEPKDFFTYDPVFNELVDDEVISNNDYSDDDPIIDQQPLSRIQPREKKTPTAKRKILQPSANSARKKGSVFG